MTKHSKKASGDVVGDDGKTVDVGTKDVSHLSGLELTGIENKRENLVTSTHADEAIRKKTSIAPLSSTITLTLLPFRLLLEVRNCGCCRG